MAKFTWSFAASSYARMGWQEVQACSSLAAAAAWFLLGIGEPDSDTVLAFLRLMETSLRPKAIGIGLIASC